MLFPCLFLRAYMPYSSSDTRALAFVILAAPAATTPLPGVNSTNSDSAHVVLAVAKRTGRMPSAPPLLSLWQTSPLAMALLSPSTAMSSAAAFSPSGS